ncbi:MAG: DMT family transporter [Variibacter sp.]|nr:DMT family transporter [Variibacter sp.]
MRPAERTITVAGAATPDQRRRALAFAALLFGAIGMGASPVFVRLADVGPHASAFWRTFLALPFLWAWARLEAAKGRAPRGAGLGAVLLSGVFFAGDLFFWHLSILATTVANATFLATTSPIWVAAGAWLVLSERIGVRMLAGLALCIAGGFALIGESYALVPQRVRGDVYGLATAVFFGAYVLAMRAARAGYGAARLIFLSTAVTAACLFAIALAFDRPLLPRSLAGAAALLALALVSQVGGQGLLSVALGTLPATFSSLVIFLEAIAAATFGWVVLGEALGWTQALGGVLILAGIFTARPRGAEAGETGS